jgi:hypothetical protein
MTFDLCASYTDDSTVDYDIYYLGVSRKLLTDLA